MNAIATAQPGQHPGNSPDESDAEKAICEDCGQCRPDGLNADGRSLCRECARRADCDHDAASSGGRDE